MDRALAYRNNPLSSLGKGTRGRGGKALQCDWEARRTTEHTPRAGRVSPPRLTPHKPEDSSSSHALGVSHPAFKNRDTTYGAVGSLWAFGSASGPWGRGHTNGRVGTPPSSCGTWRGGLMPAGRRWASEAPVHAGGGGRGCCRHTRGKASSEERRG